MTRRLAALVLVALMATPGAAAWDQLRGNAERSRVIELPDGPLDVLGTLDIVPGEERLTSFLAPIAVERANGELLSLGPGCSVVSWTPAEGARSRRNPAGCSDGTMLGLDEGRDLLLVCQTATSGPFLRAFVAEDLALAWAVEVADIAPAASPASAWTCTSAAYHPATDAWYVLLGGAAQVLLASVDAATGDVRWASAVSAYSARATGVLSTPLSTPVMPSVFARGLAVTDTGVVVTLYVLGCPACAPQVEEGAVAWFTLDGVQMGAYRAATDGRAAGDASSTATISHVPVAQRNIATLVLGGRVALVNPESGTLPAPVPLRGLEPSSNYIFWQPPVWEGSTIVYPQLFGLVAYSSTLDFRWAWTGGVDNFTSDVAVTSHGTLLALQGEQLGRARLVELALDDGAERGHWPLPIETPAAAGNDADYDAQFLATREGSIMTIDPSGQVVLLGAVAPAARPDAGASTIYPAPSERVVLSPTHPDAVEWRVHWGDGNVEVATGAAPTFSHAWGEVGDPVVRVTAVLADGRTASRALTVHVGGVAPQELSIVQKAFSPEWQEWTFFGLGLAVTIVGVAFTVGRQRHRLGRLERELAAVEEIRLLSVDDPREAARSLKAYRERLPLDLARRRIDEAQFHVLDVRSARLLRVLRTRMLAPYDAQLSTRYHRLLDAAFDDAILQRAELDALVVQLEFEEALAEAQREEIRAILRDFTTDHAGLRR